MEIITILLKDLLLKAEKNNRAVYLKVLKTNIKAQNLYQRLGFIVKEETETYIKIIYKKIQGLIRPIARNGNDALNFS